MAKKILTIDPDLQAAATDYVSKQLDIMEKHGSRPMLSPDRHARLIYDVARHPQEIRNLDEKLRNKRKLPHAFCFAGPEGWSLLCSYCNQFEYVKEVKLDDATDKHTVTCSKCQRVHEWKPKQVLCASPSHNEAMGCNNPFCFKHRGNVA